MKLSRLRLPTLVMVAISASLCVQLPSVEHNKFLAADELTESPEHEQNADHALKFAPAPRVVLKTVSGETVRGELKAISRTRAVVVADQSRFRKPEGVEYALAECESLSIPVANLNFRRGDRMEDFLQSIRTNAALTLEKPPEPTAKQTDSSPEAMRSEDSPPAATETVTPDPRLLGKPTITIICSNCEKEVSLTSDSGQTCPHCNILWDSSPIDFKEFERMAAQERMLNESGSNGSGTTRIARGDGLSGDGRAQPITAPQPMQPLAPPPPPMAEPQEITLENLPLWVKVTIFFICIGALYYSFFYIR